MASAQDHRLDVAKKFIKFYNAKQTDSVYALFGESLTIPLDVKVAKDLLEHLYSANGKALALASRTEPSPVRSEFILTYEKPAGTGLILAIGLKIEGIRGKPRSVKSGTP